MSLSGSAGNSLPPPPLLTDHSIPSHIISESLEDLAYFGWMMVGRSCFPKMENTHVIFLGWKGTCGWAVVSRFRSLAIFLSGVDPIR